MFARRCFCVRNHRQHDRGGDPLAVPITAAGKVVSFGGLERRTTSFRVASVALRDIPTCFIRCQKSFCMTGAILLRGFPKMACMFRGRRSTLEVSMFICVESAAL